MPTPEIMSMKMTADHKYRLPPVAGGGRAAAWSVGLRAVLPEVRSATFGIDLSRPDDHRTTNDPLGS